jgi:predicted nucleic acid-binding protein
LEQVGGFNLGAGETSSLALALELSTTVVLDDALARKRARQFNLSVVGTVGFLVLLHRRKLVENTLETDLKRLVAQGMWLDDALIAELVDANKSR